MRVLADHTLAHTMLEWLPILGLLILGVGFLVGSWRRGRGEAALQTIEMAQAQADILKSRADVLEKELHAARLQCSSDIAKLQGIVEQLRNENGQLRNLVMGETVPPALAAAMQAVGQTNREAYRAMLEERLVPIEHEIAEAKTHTRGIEGQLIALSSTMQQIADRSAGRSHTA